MEMELDQIIGYLNGEQLFAYYDGSVPCPSSSVTTMSISSKDKSKKSSQDETQQVTKNKCNQHQPLKNNIYN
jgi:uncharacterized Zn finger protein (UPF0148 family)